MVAQSLTQIDSDGFFDISEERDGGLLKKVVREGCYKIRIDRFDPVFIHFDATHHGGELHGQQIDTSRIHNKPLMYMMHDKNMLRAFLVCIPSMKIGEICELIASPDYAYENGMTVKFVLELVDTMAETSCIDVGVPVKLTRLVRGRGFATPSPGFEATISYRRFQCVPEEEFQELTYLVADLSKGVPRSVDSVIRYLKEGEHALIKEYNEVPPYEEYLEPKIVYEVKLKHFETVVDISSLCNSRLEAAYIEDMKARADGFLKAEKYSLAIAVYEKLQLDLKKLSIFVKGETVPVTLRLAILLNMSLAYLKLHEKRSCIEKCKEILKIDGSNEKALFRLAQIHMDTNDPEKAVEYFEKVLSVNPDNKLALNRLCTCSELIKSSEQKERTNLTQTFERLKAAGLGDST